MVMEKIDVINNGYIALVETWGSDERIIEAARMSTDKGFLGWGPYICEKCAGFGALPGGFAEADNICDKCKGEGKIQGDEKLLGRLYNNEPPHTSPFEMAGAVIEVQAPIFVFREWHRHRTQSYNELSARYTVLPDLFYLPSVERLMMGKQSKTNKQSSEAATYTQAEIADIQLQLWDAMQKSREVYELLIGKDLARELARIVMPVGQISRMRASANLLNWMRFLTLRQNVGAQWEIRQYANVLGQILTENFPRSMALFNENPL
jgi:thymidylate synthase (FAD)